jgi:hypothetical protein
MRLKPMIMHQGQAMGLHPKQWVCTCIDRHVVLWDLLVETQMQGDSQYKVSSCVHHLNTPPGGGKCMVTWQDLEKWSVVHLVTQSK